MVHWRFSILTRIILNDTGIYNAMNKGINLSSGKYISFLNSDDVYITENFDAFMKEMGKGDFDYIYGNVIRKEKGRKVEFKPIPKKKAEKYGYLTPILTQPASFIKRTVYEEIGTFDEQFKIAGDTDFLIRLIVKGDFKGKYVDKPINLFAVNGVSNRLINFKEHHIIKNKYNIKTKYFYKYLTISTIKKIIYRIINILISLYKRNKGK